MAFDFKEPVSALGPGSHAAIPLQGLANLNPGPGAHPSFPAFPLDATFLRSGDDLVVVRASGEREIVENFFAETPPEIVHALIPGEILNIEEPVQVAGLLDRLFGREKAPEPIGEVEQLVGLAMAITKSGTARVLHQGDSVFKGESIKTGRGAGIGIRFADGTTFQLGKSSQAVLDDYQFDPGTKEGLFATTLVVGFFRYVTAEIRSLTGEPHSKIVTPTATIGIRGTDASFNVQPSGETETIIRASKLPVTITNNDGTSTRNYDAGTTIKIDSGSSVPDDRPTTEDDLGRHDSSIPPPLPHSGSAFDQTGDTDSAQQGQQADAGQPGDTPHSAGGSNLPLGEGSGLTSNGTEGSGADAGGEDGGAGGGADTSSPEPQGPRPADGTPSEVIPPVSSGSDVPADFELLVNGSFETGTLEGWMVADGGSGSTFVTSLLAPPNGNFGTVGASDGSFYVLTTQGGPGRHAVFQKFTVPGDPGPVVVSFDFFAQTNAGQIIDPIGLDQTGPANQHARFDILRGDTVDPFDTGADVLANFFIGITAAPPSPYSSISVDITDLVAGAGGPVDLILRAAQVDNLGFFNLGFDNASVLANAQYTAMDAIPLNALSGIDALAPVLVVGAQALAGPTIEGTDGNDVLLGSPLGEILLGGAGNDVLDGLAGDDLLLGGEGDDRLIYDAEDKSTVDGGAGTDTLAFESENGTLDLSAVYDGRLNGIERVDLSGHGDNTLKLGIGDVFDLTDGTDAFIQNGAAQLLVTGDPGDLVESTGQGWVDQGPVDIGGVNFASFANQDLTAQLLVESDVSTLIS